MKLSLGKNYSALTKEGYSSDYLLFVFKILGTYWRMELVLSPLTRDNSHKSPAMGDFWVTGWESLYTIFYFSECRSLVSGTPWISHVRFGYTQCKNGVQCSQEYRQSPPPPSSRGLINFTPQERWAYRNREGLIPTAIKYLSCSQLSTLNSSV